MQNPYIRYVKGYVKIRLESSMPERFFGLCAKNHIELSHLICKGSYYECELCAGDFFRLAPFRRKTSAHITILEKHGMPFFFRFVQKRKAFFLGFFIFWLILGLNASILWDIRIYGNSFYSDETILDELRHFSVTSGMFKKNLNCQEISTNIRNSFSNIVWVSAKLEGCCLILDIKENENPNAKEEISAESWNLVAERGGEIVSIITRTGVAKVGVGDICEKGDILVEGIVEILNQDLVLDHLSYVQADADIQIKTSYPYYDEFSLDTQKKVYIGSWRRYPMFRMGELELSYIPKTESLQDVLSEAHPLTLTGTLSLPIYFGWNKTRTYVWEDYRYTTQEAQQLARRHLQTALEAMVQEQVTILTCDLEFSVLEDIACCSGYIWVLESPIAKKEITVEQSKENGS